MPSSADVNHTLEVWVTAGNASGTAGPVNSKPTAVISPALPPTNTKAPRVVGKPLVGEKLLLETGSLRAVAAGASAMKVWVVGASGKLAHYLIEHSLDRGYDVVAVCREQSVGKLEAFEGRIEIVPGPTNDREVIKPPTPQLPCSTSPTGRSGDGRRVELPLAPGEPWDRSEAFEDFPRVRERRCRLILAACGDQLFRGLEPRHGEIERRTQVAED